MPTIVIHRKREGFNGMFDIRIFLNGNPILSVGNGETKTVEIETGKHTLQGGLSFMKSQVLTLDFHAEETRKFVVGGFGKGYFKTFLNLQEAK